MGPVCLGRQCSETHGLEKLTGCFGGSKAGSANSATSFFTDVEKLVHHLETSVGIDMHDDGEVGLPKV